MLERERGRDIGWEIQTNRSKISTKEIVHRRTLECYHNEKKNPYVLIDDMETEIERERDVGAENGTE